MKQQALPLIALSTLALCALGRSAAAQAPTFVKIQEKSSFAFAFPGIGIKSGGLSAFRDTQPERIRTGTGTFVSTLVTQGDVAAPTTEILATLGQADYTGTLVLSAITATGDAAIFTKAKPYTLIAKRNTPSPDGSFYDTFGPVRIGADTTVGFLANTGASFSPAEQSFGALFGKLNGGVTALLARVGQFIPDSGVTLSRFSNAATQLSIAGGRAAFIAEYDPTTARRGIFVVNASGTTPPQTYAIVGTPNPADGVFDRFDEVATNASGSIAFTGHGTGGTENGLWINFQKVAGTGFLLDGSFSYTVSNINLNALGTATFFTIIGTKPGIYAVRNSVIKPVIRKGDTLFGATVVSLSLPLTHLNDNNQVLFNYTLNNGKAGVAVATLP